jgi:hypothetical protein
MSNKATIDKIAGQDKTIIDALFTRDEGPPGRSSIPFVTYSLSELQNGVKRSTGGWLIDPDNPAVRAAVNARQAKGVGTHSTGSQLERELNK